MPLRVGSAGSAAVGATRAVAAQGPPIALLMATLTRVSSSRFRPCVRLRLRFRYVVDSADPEALEQSRHELHELLSKPSLAQVRRSPHAWEDEASTSCSFVPHHTLSRGQGQGSLAALCTL